MPKMVRGKKTGERKPTSEQTPGMSELDVHRLVVLKSAASALVEELDSLIKAQEEKINKIVLYDEVERFERDLIRGALKQANGNWRRAAQLLGMKYTTFYSKMSRKGIATTNAEG